MNADNDDAKHIINVKQFAKFVVDLAEQVASTDIEEGMRVGVDRNKYQIHIPLPPKIDPSVTMMQVKLKSVNPPSFTILELYNSTQNHLVFESKSRKII